VPGARRQPVPLTPKRSPGFPVLWSSSSICRRSRETSKPLNAGASAWFICSCDWVSRNGAPAAPSASPAQPSASRTWNGNDEAELSAAIIRLASEYGRYGYRRITALLRVEGWRVGRRIRECQGAGADQDR
jgi:hypothetical protein